MACNGGTSIRVCSMSFGACAAIKVHTRGWRTDNAPAPATCPNHFALFPIVSSISVGLEPKPLCAEACGAPRLSFGGRGGVSVGRPSDLHGASAPCTEDVS
jgi:hypothetical protein